MKRREFIKALAALPLLAVPFALPPEQEVNLLEANHDFRELFEPGQQIWVSGSQFTVQAVGMNWLEFA